MVTIGSPRAQKAGLVLDLVYSVDDVLLELQSIRLLLHQLTVPLCDCVDRSGKVTRWALTYYILSMFIAIIIGIACVFTINPGKSRPFENPGSSASCAAENTAAVQDA